MKKIALMASVLLLVLSSCSSDSSEKDTPVTMSTVLVKKIIELDRDGKEMSTTDFVYNGNKIVSEVTAKKDLSMIGNIGFQYIYKKEYVYTGNLITSVKVKNIFNKDKLFLKTDFFYDSNENLIASIREEYFETYKITLRIVYNKLDTNTVSCKMYYNDSRDNIETQVWEGKFSYDGNKNLVKSDSLDSLYLFGSFEYDTKSSPKKGILGLDKIVFYEFPPMFIVSFFQYNLQRFNNVVKSNIGGGYSQTFNQYSYNGNGYPNEMKEYIIYNGNSFLNATFQYFYE